MPVRIDELKRVVVDVAVAVVSLQVVGPVDVCIRAEEPPQERIINSAVHVNGQIQARKREREGKEPQSKNGPDHRKCPALREQGIWMGIVGWGVTGVRDFPSSRRDGCACELL